MSLTIPPYDLPQLTDLLGAFTDLYDVRVRVLLTAPAGMRYKQRVYSLGLQNLRQGTQAATIVASRYLAVLNGLAVAADVTEPAGDAAPKIASISSGTKIHEAIDAIHLIQRLPEVQRAEYELATLRVPGVLTEAYWLKFLNGGQHLFVPYLSLNKRLKLREPLDWGEFVQKIGGVAEKNLEFYAKDMADVRPGDIP